MESDKKGWLNRVREKLVPSTRANQIAWTDVQWGLPKTLGVESIDGQRPDANPIANPWVQCGLHGLASAAPSIHTAASSGKYLKIIGPPAALDGTLEHLRDKQGNILGGLVGKGSTKLKRQTRFEQASGSLNAAAATAATFQVLSVATAQYYLHNISKSLESIETKIDDLKLKLESRQLGEIKGALETIDEVYARNLRSIENTGSIDWQAPDKIEFWTRMANAEQDLRANVHALEQDIRHELDAIVKKVRSGEKRRKESYKEHQQILGELHNFQQAAIVQNYLLALRGMMRWYQVVLAFDAHTWNGLEGGRYEQMVQFVRERHTYFSQLADSQDFILKRPDGAGWKDTLISFSIGGATSFATSFATPLVWTNAGLIAGQKIQEKRTLKFREHRQKTLAILNNKEAPLLATAQQFAGLNAAFDEPREFYIGSETSNGSDDLVMLTPCTPFPVEDEK